MGTRRVMKSADAPGCQDVLTWIENQTRRITDLELIDLARMLRVPVGTLLGKGK